MISGAYIGGMRLTRLSWANRGALRVRFETLHTDCLHQLYAGRQKIGQTLAVGERSFIAKLKLSDGDWPPALTLLAVLPSVSGQDFGDSLPPRPFNRPQIDLITSGVSWANAKTIEVVGSDVPGDPIDADNVLARMVYQWEGAYSLLLPPHRGGFHRRRVQGRDNTPPAGNVGASAETTVRVVSHPPDLVDSGSGRFSVAVAGGVATIDCEVG